MAICTVFYLTRGPSLDASRLWRLADTWDCTEKWADLLAFVDQRDVQQADLFLPWNEFIDLARDYNVYPGENTQKTACSQDWKNSEIQ
jgi:hypothetical protein